MKLGGLETVETGEKVFQGDQEITSEDVKIAKRKALGRVENIVLIWNNSIPKDLLSPGLISEGTLQSNENIYSIDDQTKYREGLEPDYFENSNIPGIFEK